MSQTAARQTAEVIQLVYDRPLTLNQAMERFVTAAGLLRATAIDAAGESGAEGCVEMAETAILYANAVRKMMK